MASATERVRCHLASGTTADVRVRRGNGPRRRGAIALARAALAQPLGFGSPGRGSARNQHGHREQQHQRTDHVSDLFIETSPKRSPPTDGTGTARIPEEPARVVWAALTPHELLRPTPSQNLKSPVHTGYPRGGVDAPSDPRSLPTLDLAVAPDEVEWSDMTLLRAAAALPLTW